MKWYSYNINELGNEEYYTYYLLMSNEKKNRVDSLRRTDDKKRTVTGEMLARKAISEWCGVNRSDINFEITSYGKPYARGLNIEFNIAHSGDMVVCAVDNKPVGIDVEKIRSIDLEICKYICTEKEIEYIFGVTHELHDFCILSDANRLIRFFEVWTAKEAYLKKIGTGINSLLSLRDVKVDNLKKSITMDKIKEYVITVCVTQ